MAEAYLTIVGLLFLAGSVSIFWSLIIEKHYAIPIRKSTRSDYQIAGEVEEFATAFSNDGNNSAILIMEDD